MKNLYGNIDSQDTIETEEREMHGMTNSKEFNAWRHMRARCFNKDSNNYSYYGRRGITVCKEWANSFQLFFNDMGPAPSPTHSLERIDNDKDYTPCNCKWATKREQARNRGVASNAKSGVNGVYYHSKNHSWVASWQELNGPRSSRSFNISKYGDEAFNLAVKTREDNFNRVSEDIQNEYENKAKGKV